MGKNASYYPQLTDCIRDIIEDMSENVIQENRPIIVIGDYSWCVYALSLLAKQINLCDSCILLLENGMEQEAYLMARSQFNNLLWIKYICNDEDGSRIKEYIYQPYVSRKRQATKIKEMIAEHSDEFDERFHEESFIRQIDDTISESSRILQEADMSNLRIKTVMNLAEQEVFLLKMYVTMYNEGSQIEHSDVSAIDNYREKVLDEYRDDQVFRIDLSKSDKETWLKVVGYTLMCLFNSFEAFYNRVSTKEKHLFESATSMGSMFQKDRFHEIMKKFYVCQRMLKDIQEAKIQ